MVATVASSLVVSAPASAAPDPAPSLPKPSPGRSVSGVKSAPTHFQTPRDAAGSSYRPSATAWPAAAEAEVTLKASRSAVAGSPVSLTGGRGSARVRVADRASAERAGVRGLLVSVAPGAASAGKTRVAVDYQGFAEAYGGNYGARLRLVRMPACAATTPEVAACQERTALPSTNNVAARSVSAEVPIGGAAFVVAADPDPGSGGGKFGTYAATELKASGSWSAGGSSGSFSYSNPIAMPPAVSDLTPEPTLSYDSAGLDGQTTSTQAQSSWAGDGWSTPRSYIEQTFTSCRSEPEGHASPKATDDLCYAGPILTLSLNGSTTALVWDEGQDKWKPESDNGEVITRGPAGSDNGSGANDPRYWQVLTRDGTVYQFGRNRLPGWNADRPVTNSVDTVPVFSPRSNGPCYKSSGFAASVCTMAQRWSLDYVADLHGNAMTYYYQQETNRYGQNEGATDVSYVRDSWLDRIEYGFTGGNVYGNAPNRVVFAVANRCDPACGALSESTKSLYPDVPFDLVCASGDCPVWGPSFFSTKRLASITTQQWHTGSNAHVPVDRYELTHRLPATGDGSSPTLWLASIQRTGYAAPEKGTSITLPSVSFTSVKLANRVDLVDGLPSFYRHRLESITTETGSVITASYERPNACGATKPTPASNTTSCYPVRWTPAGFTEPTLDWFNKYAVTRVTATDPTGGAAATSSSYSYLGGAAWHYDDNELVKAKHRTYGQFRGYGKVQTFTGDGVNDRRTKSETTYYRGMSKNNNTTVVNVTDSQGGVHEDVNELAGATLEASSYKGEGGGIDSSTVSAYWVSGATATRTRIGLPALTSNRVATVLSYNRNAVVSGGSTTWRSTRTDSSYDAAVTSPTFGLLKATYTHTVPANAAYDQCAVYTYAPVNTTKNLVGLVSQEETVAKACGGFTAASPPTVPATLNTLTAPASVSRPAQVISVNRTFYDDQAWSTTFPQTTAPSRGLATMSRGAQDYVNGAYVWQTAGRSTFDSAGREVDEYDANGNKTTTAYAVNAAGLPTGSTVTNPFGHQNSLTTDPMRGTVLTTVAANSEKTTQEYDALGRTTSVWLNSRATSAAPHRKFTYAVSKTGITSTTSEAANDFGGYLKSIALFDAQLRLRQTQTVTPQGGRLVSDTLYDTRGWTRATYNGWWDSANEPSGAAIATATALPSKVPNQTFNTYDGLGNAVIVEEAKDNVVQSRTTTVAQGDRVTIVPPEGSTVTTTVSDPVGRKASLLQYTSRPTVGTPSDTFTGHFTVTGGTTTESKYSYDAHGNQDKITDADGNEWTAQYDLLGRVTAKTDPDAGATTGMTYDANGNLTQSTDARLKTTSLKYDALDRKTAAYSVATADQTDAKRTASWVYDNADNAVLNMPFAKGKLTSSTAYWEGRAYKTQVKGYNVFGASTGESITIPTEEGLLGGTYDFTRQFTPNNGLLLKEFLPNKGGLPGETTLRGYDNFDQPSTMGGLNGLAQGVTSDAYGRVTSATIGSNPNAAAITNTYDEHTGQLASRLVTRTPTTPGNVDKQDFKYDKSGNIQWQKTTRSAAGDVSETQCYRYDELVRLTEAWTATDQCATQPTDTNRGMVGNTIGGNSAYWTSWSFDAIGNRVAEIQRNLSGGTDKTIDYHYDGNGKNQPHTLTGTTSTAPSPATSFAYDATGNMISRNAGQGQQTLDWNENGQLTKVSGPSGTSTSIYDTEGNLLLQKDPGTTTLYLPGQQHVLNTATQSVTGTRYYALPGGGSVARNGAGSNYTFVLTDGHGTPTLYLNNTAQSPTWRQFTPYGGPRGAAGSYPDNHGFLDKPMSGSTGLTRIGVRDYDPVTGSFISVDPLQDRDNPQQWHGYSYAGNNPITFSDPDGKMLTIDDRGSTYIPPPKQQTTVSASAHKSKSKGSSTKRFFKAMWKDTKDTVVGTGKMAWDSNQCSFGKWNHCRKLWGSVKEQASFAVDISQCGGVLMVLGDPFGGCGRASEKIGCPPGGGLTAECAGHLTFFVASVVLTRGPGKLAKLPPRTPKPPIRHPAPKEPAGVVKSPPCHSFAAGTLVLMADGSRKPIEDIEIGDTVVATDPETGETTEREVLALFENDDFDLTDLTLETPDDKPVTVHTTQHHKFWSSSRDDWVDAGELAAGERLSSADGSTVIVRQVRNFTLHRVMHDLTVAEVHTYHVLAGTSPVLVHNCKTRLTQDQADTLRPGPYAVDTGITTTSAEVTAAQKAAMEGQTCHTCGNSGVPMAGDHQPPSGLSPIGSERRILPQCLDTCSTGVQASAVQKGQEILRNHGVYNPNAPGAYEYLMSIADEHVE